MKKQELDWEAKAEAALESLNGMSRAQANPFLYTRIKARLDEQKSGWAKAARLLSKPVLAVSAAVVLVSLNVVIALTSDTTELSGNSAATTLDKALETEYANVNYSLEVNPDR